jgi:hypothetical protein
MSLVVSEPIAPAPPRIKILILLTSPMIWDMFYNNVGVLSSARAAMLESSYNKSYAQSFEATKDIVSLQAQGANVGSPFLLP